MALRRLKLNMAKTELLILPPKPGPIPSFHITVGSTIIHPVAQARCLGVILNASLTFSSHIQNVSKTCRFFLRNITKICPFLCCLTAKTMTQALIISRLDYCNLLLSGLPASHLSPLQSILNAAARITLLFPKSVSASPLLKSLSCLPIKSRISHSILLLTFKASHSSAPPYISALISRYAPSRLLRSSQACLLSTPFVSKALSCLKPFSLTAQHLWNALPINTRLTPSLSTFKTHLKTHLLKEAYE
ncbi:hypothetical protein FKM82_030102 [Ascaphus truei]